MIQLTNISFAYAEKILFQDFSIHFKANQINCLLGGSGSGKTSILRLIAGLETPLKGQIRINETLVSDEGVNRIPVNKRNLGFIFQDLALWPHFTVEKNIAFSLKEQKRKNTQELVKKTLDLFGLKEHAHKYPHQLSGGQKQLVALARSMVLEPKILLLDEPLSNLDVKLKRKMIAYFKKIKEDFNLTLIYVTHDHKEAFALADYISVLHKGKIEETGTVKQIKNSKNEYVNYFLEY